ncbi:MAG: hypothetical protein IJA86_02010 [Clostridia bacterium]|nr:hypothetical protein [Clostridia bacterium]
MKKFLSVFLSLCLLFALAVTLSSCAHECEFSSEWSKDATSHWHACTDEKCTEVADKADHTWDEGKITTKATQEADGVKTFTCTVCAQTKTETVAFTGLSEEDWDAAFADSVFENFAYTEDVVTNTTGMTIEAKSEYKFTKDSAWYKMTMMGQSEEEYAPDKASANEARSMMVASIKSMTAYGDYTYDAATKTYKANKAINIESLGASASDVTLTFANGKLVEIKYALSITESGLELSVTSTVTLSDYGTVVLNPAN